jgi:hypothetical protein
MTQTGPIHEGQIITGSLFNEPMRVETTRQCGQDNWQLGLVGLHTERYRKVILSIKDWIKETRLLRIEFYKNKDISLE